MRKCGWVCGGLAVLMAATPVLAAGNGWGGHWAEPDLNQLMTAGAYSADLLGAARFAPDVAIATADAAEMLHLIADLPISGDALTSAQEQGWIKAGDFAGGKVDPAQQPTREQFALWTARAMGLSMLAENARWYTDPEFSDRDQIGGAFRNAVFVLQREGVLKGNPEGAFRPQDAITRAEAIRIVAQARADAQRSYRQMAKALEQAMAKGEGSLMERAATVAPTWNNAALGLVKGGTNLLEADLTGDGLPELLVAINDRSSTVGSGALFVITKDGQGYRTVQSKVLYGVAIHQVADLTGDGKPEIVWSSNAMGANTATTQVFVSNLTEDGLIDLKGEIGTTYAEVAVANQQIVLRGGLVGGWGSGKVQRERTFRYQWQKDGFALVDVVYAESEYGYHRLQDGLVAEQYGRSDDAEKAYAQAMEADRQALFTEDALTPEQEQPFGDAVRSFAQFRLGLLMLNSDRADEAKALLAKAEGPFAGLVEVLAKAESAEAGCKAAEAWATEHPEFLKALNSPRGWVNPVFTVENLCK